MTHGNSVVDDPGRTMTVAAADLAERLADIRHAFDRSFAEPPRPVAARLEDLLAVRVAERPYAIRVTAIAGLFVDRTVTPVPGPLPELLGVAGFRGAIVPVYDLGALLGCPPSAAPRWLVLAADTPAVALAFDRVDGHLRVPAEALADAGDERPGRPPRSYPREVVRTSDGVRPVVGVAELRATIATRSAEQGRKR